MLSGRSRSAKSIAGHLEKGNKMCRVLSKVLVMHRSEQLTPYREAPENFLKEGISVLRSARGEERAQHEQLP